jgi:hypothetical protein
MDDHESETEKERIEHVLPILILVATCIEQTKRFFPFRPNYC